MDVLFKIAVITLITFNLQLFGRSQPQHDPVNNKDSNAQLQFKTEIIDAQFNSTLYIKNVSLEQQYLFVYSYSETNKVSQMSSLFLFSLVKNITFYVCTVLQNIKEKN